MSDYFEDGTPLLHSANDHRGSISRAVQDIARKGGGILVTPTGASTSRTMAEIADRSLRQGAARLVTIFDRTALLHSSNPAELLWDEWVDLAPYGIVCSSAMVYLAVRLEKPDGSGGWIPVTFSDMDPSLPPTRRRSADARGYEVDYWWLSNDFETSPAAMERVQTHLGGAAGADANMGGDFGPTVFGGPASNFSGDRWPRARLVARADCASGAFDALGYRVHMWMAVPDFRVWSQEYAIPAADGGVIFEDSVSLVDEGTTTDPAAVAVVFALRRGGKTIRQFVERPAGSAEMVAVSYDPPCPPIRLYAAGHGQGTEYWHQQNGGNQVTMVAPYCGVNAVGPEVTGGAYATGAFEGCSEMMTTRIGLAAWRSGALLTEYVAQEGQPAVPVPPGSEAGCTLLVTVLRAPLWMRGHYPFDFSTPYPRNLPLGPALPGGLGWAPAAGLQYAPDGRLGDTAKRSEAPALASGEIVGTGLPQNWAHGYVSPFDASVALTPSRVRVVPVKWPAGSASDYTETHDATNVTVTMTAGVTYVILAWP